MFVGDLQKNLLLSVEKIQWNSISPNLKRKIDTKMEI